MAALFARSAETREPLGRRAVADPMGDLASGVGATQAPLWRRGLARLVDLATVFFVLWTLVVLQLLWFMHELSIRVDPAPWGRAFAPLVVFVVLSAVYDVVFLRWNAGQTPGKQLMRVRVVHRSDGGSLSAGRALARWLLPGAALLIWPLWAGLAAVAVTAVSIPVGLHRQALHDHLADTTVVVYDDPDDDERDERDDKSFLRGSRPGPIREVSRGRAC